MSSGRRAVFFDRDGVLNHLVQRDGRGVSPRSLAAFRLYDDARAAVRALHDAGFLIFVVTNQPDIARGELALADLEAMLTLLRRELVVDDVAFCPHDDGAQCDCRKPMPGMLLDLARRWQVDLAGSFIVGDSWRDVEAGRRAGCRTIFLVRDAAHRAPGDPAVVPDARVDSLAAAVAYIHPGE